MKNVDEFVLFNVKDDITQIPESSCTSIEHKDDVPWILKNTENSLYERMTEMGSGRIQVMKVAMATTKEFTAIAGGTNSTATALANILDYVSEAYERDFAVRLQLVSNPSMIYTSAMPSTPFDGATSNGAVLSLSQAAFNNVISVREYDLGHVITQFGGGVATYPSNCANGSKARAISGANYYPDTWLLSTVAHEIGHQFRGSHTMSAATGNCGGGNYMPAGATEIGSGTTILSYLGSCPNLNLRSGQRDYYFHGPTMVEMRTRLTATNTTNCTTPSIVSTTNFNAPLITPRTTAYNIPVNTPFRLSMTATDADGDILTYGFDQNDSKPVGYLAYPDGTETTGPLFKFYPPTTTNIRYFPSLENIASGNVNTYEVLPQVARTINILGIVRDNHDEGGRVSQQPFAINVQDPNCGSFAITNFNTPQTLIANGTNTTTINWSRSCINVSTVTMKFSLDGGLTFPYTIASNIANSGTYTFVIPFLPTNKGRFMLEADGQIFFNVNTANITINNGSSCNPRLTAFENTNPLYNQAVGSSNLNLSLPFKYGSIVPNSFTGTIDNTLPITTLSAKRDDNNACLNFTNPIHYNTYKIYPTETGTYTFNRASSFGYTLMTMYQNKYDVNNRCSRFITSSGIFNSTGNYIAYTSSMTVTLQKDEPYELLVHNVHNGTVNFPINYTISYTTTSGGMLATDTLRPPSNYNLGYVIVDTTTGLIKEIKSQADLRNPNIYRGGVYRIYGISTTSALNTLNTTYSNTSFNSLSSNTMSLSGGLCAQISFDSKLVQIIEPLPIKLFSFKGHLDMKDNAILQWDASEDDAFINYELERSDDGVNFNMITTIAKKSSGNYQGAYQYQYLDPVFKHLSNNTVLYRLKMNYLDGKTEYSNVIMVQMNKSTFDEIIIYPNPVTLGNDIKVDLYASDQKKYHIQLTNALGQVLHQESVTYNAGKHQYLINTHQYATGVYLLSIHSDVDSKQFKIIMNK